MIYSGSNLLGYAVFAFTVHLNVRAESGVACKDQQGRSHESGFHYIPGPEPCTFCVCDNGNPKWCKAVICKFLEEDCKSFRRGDTCCEFICLDDTLSSISNDKVDGTGGNITDGTANYDIGLRSVASFVTAVLSLSLLFFLIHRLRQRKIRVCVAGRQSRQLAEDQRNLGNMGYIERDGLPHGVPMEDIPCGTSYPLWKPPGNYFPRGEAPPPYEEAVAAARAEQALLSMNPHTLPQMSFPNSYLTSSHNHTNVSLVGSSQATISGNSPSPLRDSSIGTSPGASPNALISSSSRPVSNPNLYANYRQSGHSEVASPGVSVGTSTTSFTMGTSTYENLPVPAGIANFSVPHAATPSQSVPNSQASSKPYQPHTTLPRQTGAFTISATLPNSSVTAHRTIPRTLTTRTGARLREMMTDCSANEFLRLSSTGVASQNLPRSMLQSSLAKQEKAVNSDVFYENVATEPPPSTVQQTERQLNLDLKMDKSHDFKPPLNIANEMNDEGSFESVTCTCSMQALPTLHDDTDDYRSECENCKSATGSRYYLDNEDELVTSPHETMTLHRRPDEATSSATPQYYRTSLTLPINTRQRTRSTGVRENWFNTMPQSSTESSDEN